METLQTIVLPNLDIPGDETLYVRTNERVSCELAGPCLRFEPGGVVSTDTFYGGLTVGAWKTVAPVRTLLLELEGDGQFLVGIGVHRLGHAVLWLDEQEIALAPGTPTHVPVRGWDRVADGILFLRLRARRAGSLTAARYRTTDPARNDVRLGLVITHFNRPAQVLPAIERVRRQVLSRSDVRGRITLTVVDNSKSLPPLDGDGVTVLKNRNLGGSGGFARGLLHLEDGARATHAVFMDDDASCESDGILRTYALLRYAASPKVAVAGALLSEAEPWQVLEKGALFDGKCRPMHHGLDLRRADHLLWSEREPERPDYGGWWFFAFPIRETRRYPFPFFVRGDDVFFSLDNDFEIHTLNGVACLAEEFRVKHGPMTSYLDSRYHLLHAVMRDRRGARALKRLVSNQFAKPLMAYHYSTARAFTLALRHVMQGPEFFRRNLDLADVRKEIGSWTPSEKLQAFDRKGLTLRAPPAASRRERFLHRLARIFTLQGFLLPDALLIDRVQVQEKSFHGRAAASFRYRRVLYEHWQTGQAYLAEYDRGRFFAELRDCIGALREFRRRMPELRRAYAEAMPDLASRRFWREVYGLDVTAAVTPETAVPAVPRSDLEPAEHGAARVRS